MDREDRRREFANQYKYEGEAEQYRERQGNRNRSNNMNVANRPKQNRYSASKGTAKSRTRKLKARIASVVLAASIGVGGIGVVSHLKSQNEQQPNLTEVIERTGMSPDDLGLSVGTISKLEKYDKFFDENSEESSLSEEEMISIANELEELNMAVIKEKVANLLNEKVEDIKLWYEPGNPNDPEGADKTMIYTKEKVFNNAEQFHKKENTIPNNIVDAIWQLGQYKEIGQAVKADKMSKKRAVKDLKKLYSNIEDIATGSLTMDKDGNIIHYSFDKDIKQDKQQDKQGEER